MITKQDMQFAAPGMPALGLMLMWFKVLRDQKGTKWCDRKGVGALRDELEKSKVRFTGVAQIDDRQPMNLDIAIEIDQRALAVHCVQCGGCKRARM